MYIYVHTRTHTTHTPTHTHTHTHKRTHAHLERGRAESTVGAPLVDQARMKMNTRSLNGSWPRDNADPNVSIRQHSIRQDTSGYVSKRQHSRRQPMPQPTLSGSRPRAIANASVRQLTLKYKKARRIPATASFRGSCWAVPPYLRGSWVAPPYSNCL